MSELIHEFEPRVETTGVRYAARVYAREREDGRWEGWLEFHPTEGETPVLRTAAETSQLTREELEEWAAGIEPVYLEGALERAR
ncbi:MAG: hypothetical protein ACREKN_08405 [Longimicrobiaceae bacterium]